METNQIPPALTAEQWADWNASLPSTATADELVKGIAMRNAALPDDDPRKITKADVAHLWWLSGRAGGDHTATIAAKLAALLPPDE